MTKILSVLVCFFLSFSAHASWYYNDDGGIGAYQPEGWTVVHNGRSSRLLSPAGHGAQSSVFFGSDWEDRIVTQEDLRAYVARESGSAPEATEVSGLAGFRVGSGDHGAVYLLRQTDNVIVIEFDIRGSVEQREEARTVLDSIEVRTDGLEYP